MFFHEAAGTKAAHLLQCLRLTLAHSTLAPMPEANSGAKTCVFSRGSERRLGPRSGLVFLHEANSCQNLSGWHKGEIWPKSVCSESASVFSCG